MKQSKAKNHLVVLVVMLAATALASGCLGFGKKKKTPDDSKNVAPDKVLYERAMNDIQHSRYTVGRLSLQTLINTYPDSEYLAKAKLTIADSYYKEGGTSGLTQSVAEYKDFITFFPFLDEAPYAQMRVGMAHYRMMEKPDRDRTQGLNAENEFQTFLLKYPTNSLAGEAAQRLREVQEILAEADYRVARFYYLRQSYKASAARLLELTDRYPLYSQADRANWMLAEIYQRAEKNDIAAHYYARIVRDYPTSTFAGEAKKKLMALGVPVPQPDPNALARMQDEQRVPHQRPGMIKRSVGMFKTGPDVSMAARRGQPNLNPPGEPAGNTTLTPGGLSVGGSGAAGAGGGGSVSVETVPAGSSPSPSSGANSPAATDGSATSAGGETGSGAANPDSGSATTPATTPQAQSGDPAKGPNAANQGKNGKDKESSSKKKKKGLHKVIPW